MIAAVGRIPRSRGLGREVATGGRQHPEDRRTVLGGVTAVRLHHRQGADAIVDHALRIYDPGQRAATFARCRLDSIISASTSQVKCMRVLQLPPVATN